MSSIKQEEDSNEMCIEFIDFTTGWLAFYEHEGKGKKQSI